MMITYVPLLTLLDKRKMSIYELQEKLKYPGLRQTLNAGRYISTETIDNICELFNCKVQDVIAYERGEQNIKERVNKSYVDIDWKKIKHAAEDHGEHLPQLSVKIGFNRTYLNACCRNRKIGKRQFMNILTKINRVYNAEYTISDFIYVPDGKC